MYFESAYPNYIYAVNLSDIGRIVWKFEPPRNPNAPPVACCDVVNRGVALYNGKVYVGTLDGRLIALVAKSGAPAWDVLTVDQSEP